VLDPERHTLQVANAGHPPLLWWRGGAGEAEILRLSGVALGILPGERFGSILQATEIHLGPGDLVLGYSDGVNETHDQQGRLFGEVRLRDFGRLHAHLEPQALLDALRSELEVFSRGFGQFDDITALALKAATERCGAAREPAGEAWPAVQRGA
jgi:sigma-B regulation protein RsbU (phosphoserine phosphatase)